VKQSLLHIPNAKMNSSTRNTVGTVEVMASGTIPGEIGGEVYASDDELLNILPFHLHLLLPVPEGPVLPVRWRRPAPFLEWLKGMSRRR
jgi:hypothetical protein